jgi:hypothetical protein
MVEAVLNIRNSFFYLSKMEKLLIPDLGILRFVQGNLSKKISNH